MFGNILWVPRFKDDFASHYDGLLAQESSMVCTMVVQCSPSSRYTSLATCSCSKHSTLCAVYHPHDTCLMAKGDIYQNVFYDICNYVNVGRGVSPSSIWKSSNYYSYWWDNFIKQNGKGCTIMLCTDTYYFCKQCQKSRKWKKNGKKMNELIKYHL